MNRDLSEQMWRYDGAVRIVGYSLTNANFVDSISVCCHIFPNRIVNESGATSTTSVQLS